MYFIFPTFFGVPRREAYATTRASINIAETNDVSVVTCVIGHNKIRWKKFQFSFVLLSFVCIRAICLRLDILINEEVVIGFRDSCILYFVFYHTIQLYPHTAVTRQLIRATTKPLIFNWSAWH